MCHHSQFYCRPLLKGHTPKKLISRLKLAMFAGSLSLAASTGNSAPIVSAENPLGDPITTVAVYHNDSSSFVEVAQEFTNLVPGTLHDIRVSAAKRNTPFAALTLTLREMISGTPGPTLGSADANFEDGMAVFDLVPSVIQVTANQVLRFELSTSSPAFHDYFAFGTTDNYYTAGSFYVHTPSTGGFVTGHPDENDISFVATVAVDEPKSTAPLVTAFLILTSWRLFGKKTSAKANGKTPVIDHREKKSGSQPRMA
tara:strand:- start:110 stop:877 length:768 start_codon:yes stop_codon:yes gene_type:complete